MLHQKHESYKYVLPLKNWFHWIITRQEKNVTTAKMYILRKSALKLNFTLKIKTSWPNMKFEMAMLLCMFGLFSDKKIKNMQCKKE